MTDTHSMLEKLSFSGKVEDFAAFSERFEARMYMLNLGKCLEDELTEPAYKEDEMRGEETARVKAEDERKKQRFMVWWNLFSAWTRLQSTSSAFTSQTGWKPGKPLWGSTATLRGPAFRRCSFSWLD